MRNLILVSALVVISIFITPACLNGADEEAASSFTEDTDPGTASEPGDRIPLDAMRERDELTDRVHDESMPDQAPDEDATGKVDAWPSGSSASTSAYLKCGFNPRGWYGNYLYYTIVNCNSFGVKREIEIDNGFDDCTCHTIPGGWQASGYCYIAPWESARGIKSC